MKVLSFGEILWDIYDDNKDLAGAPLNFAAHTARHGDDAYMLSAVGDDELGKETEKIIKKWGIYADYVLALKGKETGKCIVTTDEKSSPRYDILRDVAYDYTASENVPDDFDVLYFGTMALRSEHNFNSLKELVKTRHYEEIFVDINIRSPFYNEETVSFALKTATILKISLEELPTVLKMIRMENSVDYKTTAKKILEKYPNLNLIIITLGENGSYTLESRSSREYSVECDKVQVKSVVGAGDSFSAAFLHRYFRGCDIQSCMEYATRVAGFVVSQHEAVPDYTAKDFI